MTRSSKRETRALLWLLPVLAVVSWLVFEIRRAGDDSAMEPVALPAADYAAQSESNGYDESDFVVQNGTSTAEEMPPQLFAFDPNTVEYHDLVRLGFTRGEALGIVKYRERGKVFEIPEDFAACYQVSEAMYRRLVPYIRIGEKYRLKRFEKSISATPISRQSSVYVAPTAVSEGEDSTERTASTEEQGGVAGALLSRENRPALVDLNTADSAALIAVRGIGAVTVGRIIEYRARLGGFADVAQLAEVRGVTEQNYELMVQQIFVDPAVIQKIDINFAPAQVLASHPYFRAEALRRLLKQRQLKGGWRSIAELEADDIFTTEELVRLGPYLVFN
ncbi:MAG: helix-hairpin-helix domain-containing protein [Alistipes sp.]|nr:helix-hairpin-helix domain-containing protein [Alistipes sp.]